MSGERSRSYAFGNFRLYPEEALLLRSGQPVPIPPKTFKMLCVLVEHRGHLVDKDTLMHEVWPDTFVIENNLRYNISLLRKTLSDNGNSQEFILTLPKHGYKFVADLKEIDPATNGHPAKRMAEAADRAEKAEASTENRRLAAVETLATDPPRGKQARLVPLLAFAVLGLGASLLLIRLALGFPKTAHSASVAMSRHALLSQNDEANNYFQRGVRALDRRSTTSADNGVPALEHAVALDPNFALAYAHLAIAYGMRGDAHLAGDAARKALALNASLPEAHAALGFLATYYDWNWNGAENELRRSVELDPAYARGHQWLANVYQFERRFPEADREMEAALKLDPLSSIVNADLCELLFDEQRFGAAVEQCKKTIDMDPDFIPPRGPLEEAYLAEGKYDQAAAVSIESALKSGQHSDWPRQLRAAFQTSGIRGLMQVELQHFVEAKNAPFFIARDQLKLGENEEALQTVINGYQSRDFFLPFIACNPEFAPLRSDPRFLDILRRIGLP